MKNVEKYEIKTVNTKCENCEKDSQCFIIDEVFANGLDWQSEPRCRECFIANQTENNFEEIAYNADDDALKAFLPAIKRLSDDALLQFMKAVAHRMEF